MPKSSSQAQEDSSPVGLSNVRERYLQSWARALADEPWVHHLGPWKHSTRSRTGCKTALKWIRCVSRSTVLVSLFLVVLMHDLGSHWATDFLYPFYPANSKIPTHLAFRLTIHVQLSLLISHFWLTLDCNIYIYFFFLIYIYKYIYIYIFLFPR